MAPTHDLKRVLQSAAETGRPAVDPADDLARAHTAARARARRRLRVGLAGIASVTVLAVGAVVMTDRDQPAGPVAEQGVEQGAEQGAEQGVELVAQQFDATPYTFDLTPKGWSVQGQNAFGVTIAPDDGSTSDISDDFEGKLVIMFDANRPTGRVIEQDGRTFWTTGDSGYTTVSTRTLDGEPAGVVRIQYPRDTGWDESSMVAFLASVHVGPGARLGHG